MKGHIQRLVQDSLHGSVLKLLALGARLAFFVLVIPRLPSGVLSGYMFANSVAVMGATILILGLDEELPRIIGGSVARARAYIRWFYLLSALGLSGLAALIALPSLNLAIIVFLLAVSAGRILAGIIRSIDPRINEQIQNLPWVAFIAVVYIFRIDQTVLLIAVMAGAFLLVQYLGAYLVLSRDDFSETVPPVSLVALVRHGLKYGSSRLVSNFFLLGIIRGPIIWPVWLGISGNLDQIAFAVAVGDIVTQFGRIPANQAYARWCRKPPMHRIDWRAAVTSSALLSVGLFVVASLAIAVASELNLLPKQASNIGLQIQALLLSASVPGIRMVIYLLWSRGILAVWIASLLSIMLLLSIASIYWIDMSKWFYVLAFIMAAGAASMAAKSRHYFEISGTANGR